MIQIIKKSCYLKPTRFVDEVVDFCEYLIDVIPESLITTEYTMHIEDDVIKEVYTNAPHTNADPKTGKLCFEFNYKKNFKPTFEMQQNDIERILSALYNHGVRLFEHDKIFDRVKLGEPRDLHGGEIKYEDITKVIDGI